MAGKKGKTKDVNRISNNEFVKILNADKASSEDGDVVSTARVPLFFAVSLAVCSLPIYLFVTPMYDLSFSANLAHFAIVTFIGAFFLTQSHSIAAKEKYLALKVSRASSPLLQKSGKSTKGKSSKDVAKELDESAASEAVAYALFANNAAYALLYILISLKLFPATVGIWFDDSARLSMSLANYATSVILPAIIVWLGQ